LTSVTVGNGGPAPGSSGGGGAAGGGGGGGSGSGAASQGKELLLPHMTCPTVGSGTIQALLPNKSIASQVADGLTSYVQGFDVGATQLVALTGVFGPEQQQEAENANSLLGQSINAAFQNPNQFASGFGAVVAKYPYQFATRVGVAVAVGVIASRAGYPEVGVSASALALYGNGIAGVYKHPLALSIAIGIGNICSNASSSAPGGSP